MPGCCRRGGETKVAAELVWIEIGTDVVEHEPLDFSFTRSMDGAARKRINALLREFDSQKASLAQAARSRRQARRNFPL